MITHLNIIITVLFRVASVVMILCALYGSIAAAAVGLLFSGTSTGLFALPALVISVCGAIVLWLLAKPIARIVTANL